MKPSEQSTSLNGNYVVSGSSARNRKKDKLIELRQRAGSGDISRKVSSETLRRSRPEEPGELRSLVESLSSRELQIFIMLGRAQTTRQIASELSLCTRTIEAHLSHIKAKLGIESFNELIVTAALWVNT